MSSEQDISSLIAVVGMAGRFPGARTVDDFWRNVAAGVESVHFFTDEELGAAGESAEALRDPAYVKAWPILEDIDAFDAGFFGMSPRDAAVMDPQHRFFLEVAWEALENAGYDAERAGRAVGVFAACGQNSYMMHHLVTNRDIMDSVGEWLVRHLGNDMNFLATRVSYQMNLRGPSMNVQTACSSSLVAVHAACQSLLNSECDMALAGASTMSLPQDRGYLFKQGEILSPDGHCRPFDAGSRGTLFGSGAGCVVLKRLADALADGDRVVAVIRGSAINNDGSGKIGYLAPSVDGQVQAISEALAIGDVHPESIGYIETHGTGTAIGDPIEITAITQAFRAHTEKRRFCAIGSVKANIGHLGEAAGMAGLIKAALALSHRALPPSINYDKPNPEIDFASSPVFVNTELTPWHTSGGPRRAGVTALGAGGTNAHVVLEEAPPAEPSSGSRGYQLFAFSARTEDALERMTDRLMRHLRDQPGLNLADAAYTLQVGRKQFAHRRTLVGRDVAFLVDALDMRDPKRIFTQVHGKAAPATVFMFPGGGAQYASMGQELYETEPVYREALDGCLAALPAPLASTVRAHLFPAAERREAATLELERPSLSLPALFATEYAMAKLLLSFGLAPVALIGHSMGEYVAACLAGVMSARAGMEMVALRGRLFDSLPAGAMLSVPISEEAARALLGSELSLAAANAPELSVVSGPIAAIEALEKELAARDLDCTRVRISVAAHSQMLAPILDEFERFCRTIELSPPTVPLASNLTGTWMTPEEATDPTYWVRHLRHTVQFSSGLASVLEGQDAVLVEVGPGRTLSSLARQQATPAKGAFPSLRHPKETGSDVAFLLQTLGRLWLFGIKPDWALFYGEERRQRIPLPTYPFERERYWIARGDATQAAPKRAGALAKTADVGDWFYLPGWKRSVTPSTEPASGPWLIFCDEGGIGERLSHRLTGAVIRVTAGQRYEKIAVDRYAIRPGERDDYEALLAELRISERMPAHVVHLWALPGKQPWLFSSAPRAWSELARFDATKELCFDSLFVLAQALADEEQPITLSVVSSDLHAVGGNEAERPTQALLLGPTRVIPRELSHVQARSIDVHLGRRSTQSERAIEQLVAEVNAPVTAPVVAYRGADRWVQAFDRVRLDPVAEGKGKLRSRGVYVITGGLGGIGLELAEHWAKTAHARLALIGRSSFPPKREWDAWIERRGAGDPVSQRIRKLQSIEALGGEVMVLSADVTNSAQMEGAIAAVRARFGAIHGVVHSAGAIDDGLIALKSLDSTANVIAAKAKGALVLDGVLESQALDFFVVFSSVSSILGLEGQIDYTAANAFLDAFAQTRRSPRRPRILSVNWNAWREVGMAATLVERGRAPTQAVPAGKGPHPMLGRVASDGPSETVFVTTFNRATHWLLSEHVVRGAGSVIPGVGYLELARAGLAHRGQARTIELADVFFLSPFAVRAGETKELSLAIEHGGAGELVFFSRSREEPHVTGRIAYVDTLPPAAIDVGALLARCGAGELVVNGFLPQPFVDFGPRFANVRRVDYGKGEAVVSLELPAEYHGDLNEIHLHPALLDMATGGAQALVPGFDQATDFYVPFSYGKIRLYRPLPAKALSHVRFKRGGKELASFDVTLVDADGQRVADIEDFVMKRLDDASALSGAQTRVEASAAAMPALGAMVQHGIAPHEGKDAFDRILKAPIDRQIVACSVDLDGWIEEVEASSRPVLPDAASEKTKSEGFSRPKLSATYVEPRNDVERELAAMWRELLGVTEVGVHDDFFELGGHSLIAVRLFGKIRKRYEVDLPLSTLFEAPTIAACAKIVREEAGLEPPPPSRSYSAPPPPLVVPAVSVNGASSIPPPRPGPKKSRWATLVPMQSKGEFPAFYCVAGMGGTLNNLRKLALLVGDTRPFYGLQPPGADDPTKRLARVEDLASHYIGEIRAVQPHGPYLLGGYSGGGIVAFEMTRKLTERGERVAFLGFIDSYSPALPERSFTARARIHLKRVQAVGPAYVWNTIERRFIYQSAEMKRRVTRHLGRVNPEKYRYDNIQDAWVIAEKRYRPVPLPGRATLFRAREESAMGLWTAVEVDELNGWGRYLQSGVDLQICPGNHTTMCEEPHVGVLAAKLRDALDLAAPPESRPISASSSFPPP